jgi:hypothetical protein
MTNDPNKSSKRDVAPRYSDPFTALRAEMIAYQRAHDPLTM